MADVTALGVADGVGSHTGVVTASRLPGRGA